jgi:large subunit ribosomal protein L18
MDKNKAKWSAIGNRRSRVRKTVSGTAARPRLAVYRSEKHIYGQLIDDESGRTLASASTVSGELREQVKELGPTDAAKKVGEVLAGKAVAAGITAAVFDRGGRQYTGRVAALADAARAKGLQF